MKKNKKAMILYHVYERLVVFWMWFDRKVTSFEHKKMDRIYRRKGLGAALSVRNNPEYYQNSRMYKVSKRK